ncbi:MAG: Stp1/IreP family PP2C-type Ser/Thr phosphatase [Clostridia bacterium]|nr:Stp1/IreP family PP2C-type Ser/Thr phosphatase [Clostridia bacterium]
MYLYYHGLSDVGKKRSNNQDVYSVKEYKCGAVLGVVCDGMGGASGGETASSTALKIFTDEIDGLMTHAQKSGRHMAEKRITDALSVAVRKSNEAVFAMSREDASLAGMGTTLVASLVYFNRIYTVNIGDSRMYLIDDDKIVQVTHDHSYVQYLVDIGKMTEEEAAVSCNKNIIMRAVGTEYDLEPDIYLTEIKKNSDTGRLHILLCTDGLSNHVSKEKMLEIVNSYGNGTVKSSDAADGDGAPETAVEKLVETANENGGSDNITVVLISL